MGGVTYVWPKPATGTSLTYGGYVALNVGAYAVGTYDQPVINKAIRGVNFRFDRMYNNNSGGNIWTIKIMTKLTDPMWMAKKGDSLLHLPSALEMIASTLIGTDE